jgi:hypothetical protein
MHIAETVSSDQRTYMLLSRLPSSANFLGIKQPGPGKQDLNSILPSYRCVSLTTAIWDNLASQLALPVSMTHTTGVLTHQLIDATLRYPVEKAYSHSLLFVRNSLCIQHMPSYMMLVLDYVFVMARTNVSLNIQ